MMASNGKMREALTLMATDGQTIGCLLNAKKTNVLLGPCGSFADAMREVELYEQLGLPADNIRIHPSDVTSQWQDYKCQVEKRYGTRFLGEVFWKFPVAFRLAIMGLLCFSVSLF